MWSCADNKDKTLSFSISVRLGAFFLSSYDLLVLFAHRSESPLPPSFLCLSDRPQRTQ